MQYINRMCHCKLTIPLFQTSQTYRLSEHLLVAAAAVTLHCCYTIDGLLMIQFNCASCSGVPNNIQVAHGAVIGVLVQSLVGVDMSHCFCLLYLMKWPTHLRQ